MTTPRYLSKHVAVDTSEARLARVWSGVRDGLERHAAPERRFVRRGLVVLAVTVALAAVAFGSTRFRDPNFVGSPFHQAALETAGDALVLDLHDGSRLELEARTRVEMVESAADNLSMRLRHGRVECDLVPKAGRRFTLFASSVEVRVTGTRFSVELSPNGERVEVAVERGSVEVTAPLAAEPKRRLAAGERWAIELRPPPRADSAVEPNVAEPTATEPDVALPAPSGAVPSERPSAAPEPAAAGARELFDLGNAARRAGDSAGAARAYETLLANHAKDPRAGLAAFELGRLRMGPLGDARGAVTAFRRAIALAPGAGFKEDAMARLVEAYAALGDVKQCRSARQAYLSSYPRGVHASAVAKRCAAP
ncbi:MAG TPA: FecR domain-containing protein [Polyangiaceae bacterium]